MEDARLIDLGNYPEIHAAGVADCYLVGDRVRFVMFDWFRYGGIWQRRIVGTVTRSVAGFEEERQRFWQIVSRPGVTPQQPTTGGAGVH